jgi:hypothetical protein
MSGKETEDVAGAQFSWALFLSVIGEMETEAG